MKEYVVTFYNDELVVLHKSQRKCNSGYCSSVMIYQDACEYLEKFKKNLEKRKLKF